MLQVPVKELMSKALITVNEHDTLQKVAQIFQANDFHHIPIVDDDGCLTGIISLTDFERIKNGQTLFRNPRIDLYNQALFQSLLVKDVMTKDVTELQANDSILHAYAIFKKNKFRALPVIDRGKLIGILTPLDLLHYFFQPQ